MYIYIPMDLPSDGRDCGMFIQTMIFIIRTMICQYVFIYIYMYIYIDHMIDIDGYPNMIIMADVIK